MKNPQLIQYLDDPREPDEVLAGLPADELATLLDILFQELDTEDPEYGAHAWYDLAVEESCRRSVTPDGAAHGVA
ncbi:hypothetical protein OVA06_15830 [Pseudarthrobacter sp. SL88]|uniref:hypothetical protein n=1 Tax=Micrococcaceae TaxID=1268 RepID=UPI0006F3098B|nr:MULTISPECIES: hypothetical protein [Micrococcaceae]KQQ84713.1 hypothetical protein ASF64_19815 [Arthrobacter sp. Leaf137]MCY1676151.1 hypothetical protein [Pseudarthrobacter sp. SL88]MDQ1053471.1 hypothetical protein [Arthrobacter sp. SORGH_AS_0212]